MAAVTLRHVHDPSRYATRRAPNGMVASIDHLASSAGAAVLRAGGNAVDAALCANAVLAVTAPDMCGMGGDLWAVVCVPGEPPTVLNASGRAGSGADPDRLRREGLHRLPATGSVRAAPVPGCVDGWVALHERFGTRPLAELLEPAARYADEGFPLTPILALTSQALDASSGAHDLLHDPPLPAGAPVTRPGVARALRAVADEGRHGFYEGDFGRALLDLGAGEYASADLTEPLAEWVEPVHADVWGHRVWAAPPGSQAYAALAGAWIAEGLDVGAFGDGRRAHLLVEAAKQASYDRPEVLHDGADGAALLGPTRLAPRRDAIADDRSAPLPVPVADGDTIFLCAVDSQRLGVSLIQSNASMFGTRLTVGDTGIFLHNRGVGFSLRPGHPAEYRPGRRPPSTLSPTAVTRPDGSLVALVGTMGGDGQPQILLQLLVALLHDRRSAGTAVARPRWVLARRAGEGFDTWDDPSQLVVRVEADAPSGWAEGLRARGHAVEVVDPLSVTVGHAHVVVDEGELVAGAADPRAVVGAAVGY